MLGPVSNLTKISPEESKSESHEVLVCKSAT